ncbi:MAG: hypothetical protein JXB88_24085, partial [Spirochaetales bacterium]|nr:hypothetical protein [Spirochaetales bacterium]
NAIKNSSSAGTSLNNSISKMTQQITNIDKVQKKVDLSVNQIQRIKEYSSEIVNIAGTIEDISSKTNLLALNASIEAAHAGAYGKGFDIVANEIRKLSLSTKNATSDISKLINEYKSLLNSTSLTIEESKNVVDSEIKNLKLVAEQMNKSIEAYMKEINIVSSVAEKTTEAAGIMTNNSSKVMHAINEIVSVSNENSAATEEISATTIQISRHIESLVNLASSLSLMAHSLQGAILQFDLGVKDE